MSVWAAHVRFGVIDDARAHQHRRHRRAYVALGAIGLAVGTYLLLGGGDGGARSPVLSQGSLASGAQSSAAGSGTALVAGASVKEISATGASYSRAQLLKFTQCARANGDPKFPNGQETRKSLA